ncbi:glycosyltransferase involved in cell wall biosynthesis [Nakamurella sp. UYEF19]|uniref:glycosyltransferase n=1 Tax=Nakamurella sp. UYEF19 TaxID=1756392 RepID=UPI0033916AB0
MTQPLPSVEFAGSVSAVSAVSNPSRIRVPQPRSEHTPVLSIAPAPVAPPAGRGVLVHEWISTMGGSEKVLEAMSGLLPDTDVRCLWNDAPDLLPDATITETWLARTPLRRSKAAALPLMPATWRGLHNPGYDWALVSSHLFAHHVTFARQDRDFRKFVYVHTPARYLWNPELDARGGGLLKRMAARPLKAIDRSRAAEATSFAANSQFVADRIRLAWDRDATVVHPPVDVARIQAEPDWHSRLDPGERRVLDALPADFLLGASRFVPYKELDTVIRVAKAAGLPAVLAGSGPDEPRLRAIAASVPVPVIFLGRVSDAMLYALYQRTLAYVFPPIEDFGIMPVEAMAAGAPVIANRIGGAAESVVDGVTGALVDFGSEAEMLSAVGYVAGLHRSASRARALRFGTDVFASELTRWMSASKLSGSKLSGSER